MSQSAISRPTAPRVRARPGPTTRALVELTEVGLGSAGIEPESDQQAAEQVDDRCDDLACEVAHDRSPTLVTPSSVSTTTSAALRSKRSFDTQNGSPVQAPSPERSGRRSPARDGAQSAASTTRSRGTVAMSATPHIPASSARALAQVVQHAGHAIAPGQGHAPEDRSGDDDGRCPERQGDQDVAAAAHATVEVDLSPCFGPRDDVRQCVQRRDRAASLAATAGSDTMIPAAPASTARAASSRFDDPLGHDRRRRHRPGASEGVRGVRGNADRASLEVGELRPGRQPEADLWRRVVDPDRRVHERHDRLGTGARPRHGR